MLRFWYFPLPHIPTWMILCGALWVDGKLYDFLTVEEKDLLFPIWLSICTNLCSSVLPAIALVFMETIVITLWGSVWYPALHSCSRPWLLMLSFSVPDQCDLLVHAPCFLLVHHPNLKNCIPSRKLSEISAPQLTFQRPMGSWQSCDRLISHCQCFVLLIIYLGDLHGTKLDMGFFKKLACFSTFA